MNPASSALKFGQGLPTLASSAVQVARDYLGQAADKLLPARAFAVVVPTGSGVGGRTSSYSPFGVVQPIGATLSLNSPQYSSEFENTNVTRSVHVSSGLSGVPVTFTASDGTVNNEGSSQVVNTGEGGNASVTWNLPDFGGTYTLTASIPGSSVTYTVAGADSEGNLSALPCSLEGTIKSLNSDAPVNLTFNNELEEDSVNVFWLDFSAQRILYNTLASGESYSQTTFVTHPWLLTRVSTDECLGIFLPLAPDAESFGGSATGTDSE